MALKYVLEVDDKGTPKLKKFQGEVKTTAKSTQQASAAFKSAGAGLAAIGVGSVAAVAAMVSLADEVSGARDRITKMGRELGVTTEFLGAMSHSAQLGGTDIKTFEKGLTRLSKVAFDASNGLGTSKKTFDQLGLSVTDANGVLKTNDQLVFEISDKFKEMPDGVRKAALSQELFGKSGKMLINTLNGGSAALKTQADEAQRLGLVFSQEAGVAAESLQDNFLRLRQAGKGTFDAIGAEMIPIVDSAMPDLQLAMQNINEATRVLLASSVPLFKFLSSEVADLALGWSQIAKEISSAIDLKIDFSADDDPEILAMLEKQEKQKEQARKNQLAEDQRKAQADALALKNEEEAEAKKKKWAEEAKKRREQEARDAIEKNRQLAEAILDEEEKTQAQIKAWDDEILAMDQANAEARKVAEREVSLALMSESEKRKLFIEEEYQARVDVLGKTAEVEMLRMREVEELRKEQEAQKREDLLNTFSQISEGANLFGSTLENLNQAEQNRINQNFDDKKRKIEEEFALQAEGAQGNAALLESIQRSRDEKLKALDLKREKDLQKAARRTATMRKRAAQVEAIVNTAAAVTKALPNIPLSILVGLQGASQVALIESQQFFKGGMTDQGPQQISVGENGREFVVSASGTRAAGEDALQDLNNGRLEDAANRLLSQSGQSSGGVTIQIMGGVVDEMFMQNVLIPKLERYQRRF